MPETRTPDFAARAAAPARRSLLRLALTLGCATLAACRVSGVEQKADAVLLEFTSTEIYKVAVEPFAECTQDLEMGAAFNKLLVTYCWRWNGAVNTDECAYSGGFFINGNADELEGNVDRAPAPPKSD